MKIEYICIIILEYIILIVMTIFNYVAGILFYVVTPALVLWLCRRVSILRNIGPIMLLYAIGMAVGNIFTLPEEMVTLQALLPNIMVPLAIPMMLYGCSFSRSELSLQLKVCISGFLSVVISVVVGYMLFGSSVPEGAAIGGIISGMYTGGTINAAALQTIFHVDSFTFALINSYDIIISFLYFIFLFTVGIPLFRRLYGQKSHDVVMSHDDKIALDAAQLDDTRNPYKSLLSRSGLKELGAIVGTTLAVVALSAAVAIALPESLFMVVFILMLTTLGVALSFVKRIRAMEHSYDVGMYLIYIFSLAISSMADFSKLDIMQGVNLIAFMGFAVCVSLLLHALFCRILKTDADSMVISSVAFINSPPFVPMVAMVMKNRKSLITGLAAGVVGYALGNHLGVIMYEILSRI